MSREENLMILRLLQEGTITAEQAAALLAAVDKPAVEVDPVPAPVSPLPPPPPPDAAIESEALARARAKITAARERVAGVQEQLAAAEEKIDAAQGSENPMGGLSDALKDLPGMRSVFDAIKGIDANRLASDARKQARKIGKSLRDSIDALPRDLGQWAGPLGEPDYRLPLEAVVALDEGRTLRLRNPSGSIEVVGAEVPECRIAATVDAWGPDVDVLRTVAAGVQLDVQTTDDGVLVAVQGPELAKRLRCDLKVFVPAQGRKISAVSPTGDIAVRAVRSNGIVAASVSGSIEISECAGDVTTETASGSTALQGIAGNAVARSTSGDIHGVRLHGDRVSAKTQSGDIQLDETGKASLELETVSGDIRSEGQAGRVSVRTVSGDVTVSGDLEAGWDASLRTVSGRIALAFAGADTGKVDAETVSGDCSLRFVDAVSGALEARTRSGRIAGILPGGAGLADSGEGAGGTVAFGSGEGVTVAVRSLSGDIESAVVEPGM